MMWVEPSGLVMQTYGQSIGRELAGSRAGLALLLMQTSLYV